VNRLLDFQAAVTATMIVSGRSRLPAPTYSRRPRSRSRSRSPARRDRDDPGSDHDLGKDMV
jgi:hypothetical protein